MDHPPTIDPAAARRWQRAAPQRAPWLHEEVGRRMAERLEWIRLAPAAWADWAPLRGGLVAHASVAARYPAAARYLLDEPARAQAAKEALAAPWWRRATAPALRTGAVPDGAVQMLWANMALHMAADPRALLTQWHRALAVDGFVMFSCLGPDTLRELRALYTSLGWPAASHDFTDMHDWGDMLVATGFAEPVMDMERLTLTYESPERLIEELRELGANLHPARFAALRGRAWRARLASALQEHLRGADGRLALTFEIIYGHALKPAPRAAVADSTAVPVDDLRAMLRAGRERPR